MSATAGFTPIRSYLRYRRLLVVCTNHDPLPPHNHNTHAYLPCNAIIDYIGLISAATDNSLSKHSPLTILLDTRFEKKHSIHHIHARSVSNKRFHFRLESFSTSISDSSASHSSVLRFKVHIIHIKDETYQQSRLAGRQTSLPFGRPGSPLYTTRAERDSRKVSCHRHQPRGSHETSHG